MLNKDGSDVHCVVAVFTKTKDELSVAAVRSQCWFCFAGIAHSTWTSNVYVYIHSPDWDQDEQMSDRHVNVNSSMFRYFSCPTGLHFHILEGRTDLLHSWRLHSHKTLSAVPSSVTKCLNTTGKSERNLFVSWGFFVETLRSLLYAECQLAIGYTHN